MALENLLCAMELPVERASGNQAWIAGSGESDSVDFHFSSLIFVCYGSNIACCHCTCGATLGLMMTPAFR